MSRVTLQPSLLNAASGGVSKCAEIFVTNNADKWTFVCIHCQKATSDIGVFICHIRLEHLKGNINLGESYPTTESPINVLTPNKNAYLPEQNDNIPAAYGKTTEIVEAKNSIQDEQQTMQSDESQNLLAPKSQIFMQSNTVKQEATGNQELSKTSNITTLKQQENPTPNAKSHTTDDQPPSISDVTSLSQSAYDFSSETITPDDPPEPMKCDFVKEEVIINEREDLQPPAGKVPKISDVTSLGQMLASEKEVENYSNKEASSTTSQQLETNLEFYAITSIGQDLEQQGQNEIVQVVYLKENDTSTNKEQENAKDYNENNINQTDDVVMSSFTPSDDENDDVETNIHIRSSFTCGKCEKSFKCKVSLEKHAVANHRSLILKCPFCPVKRNKWCLFLAHLKTHESDTCFPCHICGKIFENNRERKKHTKEHGVEKPCTCKTCLRKQEYQCNVCSTLFQSELSQNPPYICGKCKELPENLVVEIDPAETNTAAVLMDNPDNTQTIANIEQNDNCSTSLNENDDEDSEIELITDNFPSVSSSNTNQISQNNNIRYKCLYCNSLFISERSVICHASKMHFKNVKDLANICRYCNRSFRTESSLNLHQKSHEKGKLFECTICTFNEYRESVFITHMLKHESDNCFPCQVCGTVFTSNTERLQHWRTHIEERPHGCNICFRRFHQQYILRNHMRTHCQYSCHFCHNNFQSNRFLKCPHVCDECEKLPQIKKQLEQLKSKAKKRALDSEGE
ncbi:zinc finger protein 33B-like [Lucilia sericata]|uniref:zinc finger protein 33B-like n=1 Tax=Lucilia sericata TaxID=13632 RepID=UPI0018A80121|nr:zinc finger protein 33B-like [Lucilia sericata]